MAKKRGKRILVAVISAAVGGLFGSYVGGLINPEIWARVLGAFVGAVVLGTLIPILFLNKK